MNSARAVTVVERERAAGFAALAGTHVEAMVPITQRLVDVLVAQVAAERNLSGLKVTLRADREIGVAVVKPVFGFDTRLAIDLRIRGRSTWRRIRAVPGRGAALLHVERDQPLSSSRRPGAAGRGDRRRRRRRRSPDARVTSRRCRSDGRSCRRSRSMAKRAAPCPRRGRCARGGRPARADVRDRRRPARLGPPRSGGRRPAGCRTTCSRNCAAHACQGESRSARSWRMSNRARAGGGASGGSRAAHRAADKSPRKADAGGGRCRAGRDGFDGRVSVSRTAESCSSRMS